MNPLTLQMVRARDTAIRNAYAEVERLRAAGDNLAAAVQDRWSWSGPGGCDCACCTAAREWVAVSTSALASTEER